MPYKKVLIISLSLFCLSLIYQEKLKPTENSSQNNYDTVYHYSTLTAMRRGLYYGDAKVKDLKQNGDFGIGTYNGLDGEMVVLNGNFYRIQPSGKVQLASDDKKSPFNALTFFQEDELDILLNIADYQSLKDYLLKKLKSSYKNRFVAIKIVGDFTNIEVGGATKQNRNLNIPIQNLMPNRPIYTTKNIKGTIVGFYTPSYLDNIDINGFHLHFISEDRKFGGHLINFNSNKKFKAHFDYKDTYVIKIPSNNDYNEDWRVESSYRSY